MKNIKPILLTIFCGLIVCVMVSAITYTDISPQKIETQEKEIDGEITMVEVNIDTPDEQKIIKKEWQETMTSNLNIQDKKKDLENALHDINNAVNYYNSIVGELEEVKTSLTLDIEIPSKLQVGNLIKK